jgi:AAA+ ATPase superfamily predicted ATPase
MEIINRREELARMEAMAARKQGGLLVLYGRRRLGKTRLLVEWSKKTGLYTVCDQSSPAVQRTYFAQALEEVFPGFAAVNYPDWKSLFDRLASEAKALRWTGPLIIDEFPYWAAASTSLPSVLQRWVDHDAKQAKILVALAGSNQRMMQGLVLDGNAPLYGRASEILELKPLKPVFASKVCSGKIVPDLVHFYAAFGGIPKYWELANDLSGNLFDKIDHLVLNPLGVLHAEPQRLLIEESPPALELRSILDAIGMGDHKLSNIAGRIGAKVTSMSKPLARIVALGLAQREVPFGASEKSSKRSLYKIADPFTRLWFKVVAPNQSFLTRATKQQRVGLLKSLWAEHVAWTWEKIVREALPTMFGDRDLPRFGPGMRWWQKNLPEWDVVAESAETKDLLVGECKWSDKPFSKERLGKEVMSLANRPLPLIGKRYQGHRIHRVLFVPSAPKGEKKRSNVHIVVADELLRNESD